jgi:hypothetical protein
LEKNVSNLACEEFVLAPDRDLSVTLQDLVSIDEAEGSRALVGHMMGQGIYETYHDNPAQDILPDRIPDVLVDLKKRIGGIFEVQEMDERGIVFVHQDCPFGSRAIGRTSLSMMTSNVFGYIAAESRGYVGAALQKLIAAGDGTCRVVVLFERSDAKGREYYGKSWAE